MSGFANTLMNVLLGWMRGLADGVWKLIESPGAGGTLAWFGKTWWLIALALIGGGIVIDWLVWLIRWQPYHIWATKLRRIRTFFSRAPVETVMATGVAAQGTTRYNSPRSVETYHRPRPEWYGQEAAADDEAPYEEAPYEEAPYAEELYEEELYEEEPYPEGVYAEGSYDQSAAYIEDEAYGQYDDEESEYDGDPHAAYRRPMRGEPQSIPDAQLGNYPGRRYDPGLLPRLPRQTAAPDPLAAYDDYTSDEVAEYEWAQDDLPPIVDPRQAASAPVWTDQPRRTRRRSAPESQAQPASPWAEVGGPPTVRRRRNRAAQQGPEHAPDAEPAYETGPALDPGSGRQEAEGWDEDWYEDWDKDAQGEETVGREPKPSGDPGSSKPSIADRVRKLAEPPAEPKKRGRLAQMLDPQMEPIKGLPPRVDMQRAFREPTYPEQLSPRMPERDIGQWDDDP